MVVRGASRHASCKAFTQSEGELRGGGIMRKGKWTVVGIAAALVAAAVPATSRVSEAAPSSTFDVFGDPQLNAQDMVAEGKNTFRNDTFGDETFWTGVLHLEEAIVTLSPSAALGLGLKVDARALTPSQLHAL